MYKYAKRFFDFLFSIILSVIMLSPMALCCFIIKIEDRGPFFYYGERLGKGGRVFQMYKLRTMRVNSPDIRNADGSTYNADNDPRLTCIGRILRKTSLDELPQIFNVLRGDMSFIGPRPDLPEHIFSYDCNEARKLEVRPGISGYNQVYYRNLAEWKQRLKNDVYYVDHISFFLDVKIFFKTIACILMCKGINSPIKDSIEFLGGVQCDRSEVKG